MGSGVAVTIAPGRNKPDYDNLDLFGPGAVSYVCIHIRDTAFQTSPVTAPALFPINLFPSKIPNEQELNVSVSWPHRTDMVERTPKHMWNGAVLCLLNKNFIHRFIEDHLGNPPGPSTDARDLVTRRCGIPHQRPRVQSHHPALPSYLFFKTPDCTAILPQCTT